MQLWNLFQSLTFELWKTRDEKAVPKGERRGLAVILHLSSPNTKDQHTGKKASVSWATATQPEVVAWYHLPCKEHGKGMGTGYIRIFLGTAFPVSNDLHLGGFQRQKWYFVFKSHCLHWWVSKFHAKMQIFTCKLCWILLGSARAKIKILGTGAFKDPGATTKTIWACCVCKPDMTLPLVFLFLHVFQRC